MDAVTTQAPAPGAAPAAAPASAADGSRLGRFGWFGRFGWAWSAIWLVYLLDPLAESWRNPDHALAALGVVSVLVFSAMYVTVFATIRRRRAAGLVPPRWARPVVLAGGPVLLLTTCAAAGQSGLAIAVFLAVLVMFVLPTRPALAAVAVVIIGVEVSSRAVPGWTAQSWLGFQIVVSAFAIWGVLQLVDRTTALRAAQEEMARLAVVAERNRFARDLHDILGHSLTVLTVKAELAGRLVRLDPGRAEAEIADVERLARDALADVRAAVAGYREANLTGELVAARAALDSAGIEADLPLAVDEVPGERRELFGWVVREGVTNVLRHSRAARCRVLVDHDRVRVEDDGAGPATGLVDQNGRNGRDGGAVVVDRHHGLAGLEERAAAVGARLVVGRSELGGFRLEVGW